MNMRGVFLHVMGDALGNVGVIASGLFIWLPPSGWSFSPAPLIRFILPVLLFSRALQIVRTASFVLLQGTPSTVPLDQLRNAILRIPGVLDVHELHVWSLSESKLVGSVHVLVQSGEVYEQAGGKVRAVLHRFGIHSSTIQPEILGLHIEPSIAETVLNSSANTSEVLRRVNSACPVQCDASCVSIG